MYWMVTGQNPANSIERMKKDILIPSTQLDPKNLIGLDMLGTIDWALNTDESQRPQSVAEFRKRLHQSIDINKTVLPSDTQNAQINASGELTHSAKNITTIENQFSNLVCSILFLDIVAYSKTSVNEQYELKSNFNQLIASKIAHVPESARITLDTGDGAVICFMGDPEEVLVASRDIQRSLLQQERLQVRMGLHIGPIRIINDLNGHKNVIGDGINVGQRVMSFANSNALVVSRAFYEIVSCITDGGERDFTYLGERRDKHDRAHEIYEVHADNALLNNDDRTVAIRPSTGAVENCLDQNTVARIERELMHHLGPLAPVLIRKVIARVSNEAELRNQLALSIADLAQRELFLQGGGAKSHNNLVRNNSGLSQKYTNTANVTSVSVDSHSVSEPSASIRPWLTPESIALLEKSLALAIGPLARVLVKKEARKAENMGMLCELLAQHIDGLEMRKKFLYDTHNLSK